MRYADAKNRLPPAKTIEMQSKKVDGYAGGYGTTLFEDQATIDATARRFPFLAGHFSTWSHAAAGMLQHTVWTAFTAEELGPSLQHHGTHPTVASAIREVFGVPES